MATATRRNVELVSVGTWAASTGVTKVTREDLEAMLSAHADGLVDHAPIKLGHESSLNDDLGDGAPAYGWVVPTHIDTNDAGLDTLYGDLIGIPAKLSEVMPSAFRRRSVEIAWGVKTPQGKTYPAVLIGLALLGASAPAVKGLADVAALYSEDPAEVERTSRVELVDGLEDNPQAVAMLTAARQAGATIDQLDAYAAAAGARDTADVPPPVEDADNDDTETTTGDSRPQTGRTTMARTDEELRNMLGLEADADVNEALRGILEERGETASTQPGESGEGEQGGESGEGEQQQGSEQQPEESREETREPELVTLSADTHAELTRLAQESRDRRRNDALDNAIREGRISPAERSAFAAQLERDEEGTISLLSSLAPRFPVAEVGDDRAAVTELSEQAGAAFDEFELATFPDLKTVRERTS